MFFVADALLAGGVQLVAEDPRGTRLVFLNDGQAMDPDKTLNYVTALERQSVACLGFGDFAFVKGNEVRGMRNLPRRYARG